MLQERADQIKDTGLRRSYPEHVPANREVAREWAALNVEGSSGQHSICNETWPSRRGCGTMDTVPEAAVIGLMTEPRVVRGDVCPRSVC